MGATAVGIVGVSIFEERKRERKVERAQRRRSEVESAIRADEARRSRRKQVREARIRQAEIENISAAGGQTGSSAAIAASSSLQAKLGVNVGTIQTALATSEAQSIAEQDIFEANRPSFLGLVTSSASPFVAAKI